MPLRNDPARVEPEGHTAAVVEAVRSLAPEEMNDEQIRDLMGAAVRLYAARALEARNHGLELPRPFNPEDGIAATDAMLTTTAILKAVNIQLFELGMFQSWAGR